MAHKKNTTAKHINRRAMLGRGGSASIAASLFAMGIKAEATMASPVEQHSTIRSMKEFGLNSSNTPLENKKALQAAFNWASASGAAILVEPTDEPYPVASGLVLRQNVSLVGFSPATPRGTKHPVKQQPVGSVFKIESEDEPFLTVQSATQVSGIQFWYPAQTHNVPSKIIEYPPTITYDKNRSVEGVVLNNLTFYGEFTAFDFTAVNKKRVVELIRIEHCYGYPLSGEFIKIDYCYDIPRILHCHVNPSIRRKFLGGNHRDVVDSVIARKTFAYNIGHTDNAQLMDLFTFGTYGGIKLGPETYGQLTNFNFDCVAVGIHKLGNNQFNRNWQISQGSIISNAGPEVSDNHPIIVEGMGHLSLANVESFSGKNGALTTTETDYNGKKLTLSNDFLFVRGNDPLTISIFGSRMANYYSEKPINIENPSALVTTYGCFYGQAINSIKPFNDGPVK